MTDLRMRGFARRHRVRDVWAWIDAEVHPGPAESVSLAELPDRVLARPIRSDVDVPPFDRAMMDGYAVRAVSVAGASESQPVRLSIVGESMPARPAPVAVGPGQAIRIMTGALMPAGADAVVPFEQTEVDPDDPQVVRVLEGVGRGKHIGRRGEDVPAGRVVLPQGRRLRPQDVGLISSIGQATADAVRRPAVAILVTGEEILPPGSRPTAGRIADANGPMLAALAKRDGAEHVTIRQVPDDEDAMVEALDQASREADVILASGGSSVGREDVVPAAVRRLGEVVFHGIAMRPSSPAGIGRIGPTFVFLLPGNPVSALCAYDFFAGRAIRRRGGLPPEWPYRSCELPLVQPLHSVLGRTDYVRVEVTPQGALPLAVGGASILSSTTRADGFVVIEDTSEGHPQGETVTVWQYD